MHYRDTFVYYVVIRKGCAMKFISIRDLRGKSARILGELPNEREMVVTNNGRPVAILTPVDETNVEESLKDWRRVRADRAIASMQRESMRKGTDKMTMDEIDAVIREARIARRKHRA